MKAACKFILLILCGLATACSTGPMPDDLCAFAEEDLIMPDLTTDAIEAFELGKAYDISTIVDHPETIREDLRGTDYDRVIARGHYERAAEAGHPQAMVKLATYMDNGWGIPDTKYIPEFKKAFHWRREAARRGEAHGFLGMAIQHFGGEGVRQDYRMGEVCAVQAAKLADPEDPGPAFFLAKYDLRLHMPVLNDPLPEDRKVARGVTLMEDLAFKGLSDAWRELGNFHEYKTEDMLKTEYYLRIGMTANRPRTSSSLSGSYRHGSYGFTSEELHDCIRELAGKPREVRLRIDEICPRPGGPLTRERVGLPPAPTQPLDVRAYLDTFLGGTWSRSQRAGKLVP